MRLLGDGDYCCEHCDRIFTTTRSAMRHEIARLKRDRKARFWTRVKSGVRAAIVARMGVRRCL